MLRVQRHTVPIMSSILLLRRSTGLTPLADRWILARTVAKSIVPEAVRLDGTTVFLFAFVVVGFVRIPVDVAHGSSGGTQNPLAICGDVVDSDPGVAG